MDRAFPQEKKGPVIWQGFLFEKNDGKKVYDKIFEMLSRSFLIG